MFAQDAKPDEDNIANIVKESDKVMGSRSSSGPTASQATGRGTGRRDASAGIDATDPRGQTTAGV
jgi:hypothetical protein